MIEVEQVSHSAAALRSALVDRKMLRFEAPVMVGVVPQAGRIVERIEADGRNVEIEWDDGVVLQTRLRNGIGWRVFRHDTPWRTSQAGMSVLIANAEWIAVCFDAAAVETFRTTTVVRHPRFGRLGPDLSRPDADIDRCVDLLLTYEPASTPIADVLLDPAVFCGLGNVFRAEVLWLCQMHPEAPVGGLSDTTARHLLDIAAMVVRHNLTHGQRIEVPSVSGGLAVYARTAQPCRRCGDSVLADAIGNSGRVLYWCPGCQVRQQPRHDVDDTPTDQHPAARLFLDQLRQQRRYPGRAR